MRRTALALALALMPMNALGQDFDAGLAAADQGNYATALREWRPLAEQGNASAQFNLGLMYLKGQGVPQDDAEAVRWFRMAAEQGDAEAQFNLGLMYLKGRGVPKDDAEAVRWDRLAAEQGLAEAQSNLGVMYGLGRGVPQDDVTAHMWFSIAAANGADSGAEGRDIVAKLMTAADITEAWRRAGVCVASGYRDCD